MTPAQKSAYETLERAVNELQAAYDFPDDIAVNYVLIVGSQRFNPDADADDEMLGMRDAVNYYCKLGQPNYITTGIAESFHQIFSAGWTPDDDD